MSNDRSMAIALAYKYHAGQMYGLSPYTDHLFAVETSVCNAHPTDERLAIIAILHDILEDTSCPAILLNELFEDKVVDAVHALTKASQESRSDYLARVKANPMALIVKRHDALCNLTESMKRGDLKRVAKYSQVLKELCE